MTSARTQSFKRCLATCLTLAVLSCVSAGCAHGRFVRGEYATTLISPGSQHLDSSRDEHRHADHESASVLLSISDTQLLAMAQEIASRASVALTQRLARAVPNGPLTIDAHVDVPDLRLVGQANDSAVAEFTVRAGLRSRVLGIEAASAQISTSVRARIGIVDGALVLHMTDSQVGAVRVDAMGPFALAQPLDWATEQLASLVSDALSSQALSGLGDVPVAQLRPLMLLDESVAVAPVRIRTDAERLLIELVVGDTSLVSAVPQQGTLSGSLLDETQAPIAVFLSAEAVQFVVERVLSADGGLRFDRDLVIDSHGPVGVSLDGLQFSEGSVHVQYRVFRLRWPSLIAELSGRVQVEVVDGDAEVFVAEHHVLESTRHERAVSRRLPDNDDVSQRLETAFDDWIDALVMPLPIGVGATRTQRARIDSLTVTASGVTLEGGIY